MTSESSFDVASFQEDEISAKVNNDFFAPVFLVGFSRQVLEAVRKAYRKDLSSCDVHFYAFKMRCEWLVQRAGVTPVTIVLAKSIALEGDLRRFVRERRVPVLRVLEQRCPLSELPSSDFYNGVYETISEHAMVDSVTLTAAIDLGVRVYSRNRWAGVPLSEHISKFIHAVDTLHEKIQEITQARASAAIARDQVLG